MTDDEQFMIECITTELTDHVMRDYHIGMKEALDMVYNSETYSKLLDKNSGLYYQSPLLVYDLFKEEPNKQSPNQPANYLYTLKCPNKSTNFGQNKSNKLFCPKKTLISDKIRYHDTIKSRELPTPKGISF